MREREREEEEKIKKKSREGGEKERREGEREEVKLDWLCLLPPSLPSLSSTPLPPSLTRHVNAAQIEGEQGALLLRQHQAHEEGAVGHIHRLAVVGGGNAAIHIGMRIRGTGKHKVTLHHCSRRADSSEKGGKGEEDGETTPTSHAHSTYPVRTDVMTPSGSI